MLSRWMFICMEKSMTKDAFLSPGKSVLPPNRLFSSYEWYSFTPLFFEHLTDIIVCDSAFQPSRSPYSASFYDTLFLRFTFSPLQSFEGKYMEQDSNVTYAEIHIMQIFIKVVVLKKWQREFHLLITSVPLLHLCADLLFSIHVNLFPPCSFSI